MPELSEFEKSLLPKLAIWNARLNPPDAPSSIGDLTYKSNDLIERNKFVAELRELKDPGKIAAKRSVIATVDERNPLFKKLNLDYETDYSDKEVNELQSEKANQTYFRYEPITMDKMVNFVDELTDEASRGMA